MHILTLSNEWYVCLFKMHWFLTYCVCFFWSVFRSLSFLVKLEQLDLGSNELEVLVYQKKFFTLVIYNVLYFMILLSAHTTPLCCPSTCKLQLIL